MAYRNDIDALEARHRVLEAEVVERVRARDEVAHMLLEARDRDAAERHFSDLAAGGPRRRRRRLVLIVAIMLVVVGGVYAGITGVRHHRNAQRHAQIVAAMTRFEMFTNEVCACTTAACVQTVTEEMTKWAQEASSRSDLKKLPQPDPDDIKRMTVIGERYGRCVTAAMTPPPASQTR